MLCCFPEVKKTDARCEDAGLVMVDGRGGRDLGVAFGYAGQATHAP